MASTKNLHSLLLLICHLLLLQLKADSECQKSYPCRNFTLEFPFTDIKHSKCGLIPVNCSLPHKNPLIYLREYPMDLLGKVSDNKFLIHDSVLENNFNGNSCNSFSNVTLPKSPSISFSYSPNLTTFNCFNPSPTVVDYFKHYENRTCDILDIYYKLEPAEEAPVVNDDVLPGSGCTMNQMPIRSGQGFPGEVFDLFSPNFTLEWNLSEDCYECYERGGQCLTNESNRFYCRRERGNTRLKILFIGGITIASLASLLIIVFLFIRRKRAKARQDRDRDIELFLKDNGNLVPMRYKYSSIKKMTNSFTENLGRGGFGSVYKGQFPDGRLVAVKVLNDSNGNGEDFMNEVASISRTSHVNIVTLLGFCFEGSKRALIYDFMPNGSLEKFIGNNASSSQESTLGWDKLFEITLGIARGLEYLHQGCNTRILHLDIKPQNILLDKDMNPRISDFGLAKMCPNRSSIVSMLVARGTIGYIAPEVFSRNFGDVSYKSDVYSYGMLVLEMAGGKKAIDPRDVEHTSEIYFPNYLYKEVEGNAERDGNIFEAMNEGVESQPVKRNMIIVGLWCIQTNPKDRPSMTRVVEMLEGKLGSLEVPSRPYLQPSPRAAPAYSTSESL